jgi:hypothetical protein
VGISWASAATPLADDTSISHPPVWRYAYLSLLAVLCPGGDIHVAPFGQLVWGGGVFKIGLAGFQVDFVSGGMDVRVCLRLSGPLAAAPAFGVFPTGQFAVHTL